MIGPLWRMIEYAEVAAQIWKSRRSKLIIIREFSTFYVWITVALCFPLLGKLLFVVAHNVQKAHSSPLQARLLAALVSLGPRLACLETTDGALSILPQPLHRRVICLSHPAPYEPSGPRDQRDQRSPLRVGLVGDFRPEKGSHKVLELLSELAAEPDANMIIMVGAKSEGASLSLPNIDIRSTATQQLYVEFLSSVDVLVLPYPSTAYQFRVSGILADACACGTPVLATDLPAFRAQLTTPAVAGACLPEDDFVCAEALRGALTTLRRDWKSFNLGAIANTEARAPAALAWQLARACSMGMSFEEREPTLGHGHSRSSRL
jgi:glycosyltransferase involved in cell wall biosynthesis